MVIIMSETGKNSVLIVDDVRTNIAALTNILSPEYTVYTANNGQDAIATAEKYLPDVILLDIVMPEMSGYEVISELKSSEKTRNIPVIFITGLSDPDVEEKGLSLGAADYITKPFSPAIVTLRVQNQIKMLDQLRAVNYDIMKYELTSSALKIALWDMDVVSGDPVNPNSKITWSREFRKMMGFSGERDFPNILSSWSDLLHPEDKEETINAFAAHLNDYTGKTRFDIEYRLKVKHGEYRFFHAFGTTLRNNAGVPLRVAGALMDITEKKQTQEALKNRETMLDLLNKTAIVFLSQSKEKFDEMMSSGISHIADLLDIEGFSLFRNFSAPDGLHTSQIYRWDKESGGAAPPNSFFTNVKYSEFAPNWEKILANGNVINGPAILMPYQEAASLKAAGIVSAFVVPVSIDGAFWGFALFEDRYNVRHFDDDFAETMRSTGVLCASAITRAEMESEIAKANKRTKILLDKTPLCCQLWDTNLNKIDCNEAAVRLFGFKDKQEYLERYSELYPEYQPDGQRSDEKAAICVNKAFEEGSCALDWTYRMLDGTFMQAEIFLIRVEYEDGYAVAGYTRDMREHIKMMKDIEYRDNLLRAVNRASAVLLNSDIDSFENALCESMKILADSVKVDCVNIFENHTIDGRFYCSRLFEWYERGGMFVDGTPHCYSETVPGWEETLSGGNCINSMVRDLSRKEQEHFSTKGILSILVVPIFVKDRFWGFVSFDDYHRERIFTEEEESIMRSGGMLFTDALLRNEMVENIRVTSVQLKAAAEKAREDEERIQLMLDAMPLACNLINRNYEIIDCNQEVVNLFGVAGKEEFITKGFLDILPEFQPCGRRSLELRHEYFDKAFDTGYLRYEWMYQKRGGELLPCEVTLIRVRYRGEYIVAVYARDLREQQAVLAEMRRAEIAEEGSKAKSKFLAMMSHEIRTPMNAVLGVTEIHLQDETLEPKYEEAFSKIYNSSNMLLGIINDLLDMSKIDAGKLELDLAGYETASLINDVVNLNLARFGSKQLKFELEVDENTPMRLIGDELRIKQILNNLLSNSFKYTKQGMVKLSVSAGTRSEDEESRVALVFCVSDTGGGMTKEQLSKLFDEYTRFDTEANRVTEGTGLGMHITRNLVFMMNGEILADSEIGRGTIITVRLPQEDAGAGVLGREAAEKLQRFDENKAAYGKKTRVMREPMPYGRVLVVDDSDLNLYVARGLLAPYELLVDTTESGFGAIDIIKSGQEYDIVFMDHMMPEMDGVQTVKNIRGLGYSRPIVALTADAVSGRADMFLKNGFDDFISKPIDIRHLDSVLKKLIRDRHPQEIINAARAAHKQRAEAEASESETVSAFLSAVKKIGAINAKIGLSRFSGVEDMYYNTLALFHKKLPRECDTMSDLINAQDIKGFSIAVHSIKSQLSTIGAMELSKTAQALETASKNNVTDYCVNFFPAFKESLLTLHEQLSAVFSGEEASSSEKGQKEPGGDPAYLQEHIEKALEAAGDFDGDAAVQALKLAQVYDYGEEINALTDDAMDSLGDFDFDTAAEILGKILKTSRRFNGKS